MNLQKRVVLVGAGSMGANHARVIANSASARLVALVDPNEEVGRTAADRYGAVWTPELPSLSDVDAVVVAAATESHRTLALDVLDQGVPLLVEKPVTADLPSTEEIVALAQSRDIPLMCGLLERYNPAVLTALSILDAPFHIAITRHSPYAPRIRTGVAWDLLVHDVDLAIRFMGDTPVAVDSRLGYFHPASIEGSEDVAESVLQFGNGGIAQISASRVGQRKIRQMSIYEAERLIEVDLLRRDVTVYHHVSENSADGAGRGYKQQTVIEIPELVSGQEALSAQFDRFLSLIDGAADAEAERASILPAHRVIADVTRPRVMA